MEPKNTDNVGNNRKDQKKLGRPANKHESISVHCRVPHDLYQLLMIEMKRQEKENGHRPALAAVMMGLAKKSLI